jgi:hypothetical protein
MAISLSSIPKRKLIIGGVALLVLSVAAGVGAAFLMPVQKSSVIVDDHKKPLNLAGRGTLPPLDVAMAHDPQLKIMVHDLSDIPATEVFVHGKNVDLKIASVLFRWAEADMTQKGSYGSYIDARVATFLKKIGSFSAPPGTQVEIRQATDLNELWFKVFDRYRIRLLALTSAKGIFSDGVEYNQATDTLTINGMLSADFANKFEEALKTSPDSGAVMHAFLDFITATKGFDKLNDKEQDLIMGINPPKPAQAEQAEPQTAPSFQP